MTGQKGGHKDRIKTWKIIYNQRRQEKLLLQDAMMRQKREERQKQKKLELQYRLTWKERTMSFFHMLFGLFLGIFTPRQVTREKQIVLEVKPGKNMVVTEADGIKLEAFQKEVLYIERKMNSIAHSEEKYTKERLLELKNNIAKKKKTLAGISLEYQNTKKKYGNQKIDTEDVADLLPTMRTGSLQVGEPIRLEESIKKAEKALLAAETVVLAQETAFTEEVKQKENVKIERHRNQVAGVVEPVEVIDYIKQATKDIKKKAGVIEKLENQLKKEKDPFVFQETKRKLRNVRDEVFQMKLLYNEMDRQYGFYHFDSSSKAYELDQFQLLTSGLVFDGMLEEIDDTLHFQYKETEESHKKKKEEKKKEEKRDKLMIGKEKFLSELDEADQMVTDQIKQQKNQIAKLRKELSAITVPKKRKIFHLGFIGRAVSNIAQMIAGVFSFSFFKNKAVGLLTGAFFINNGIRGLKKAIKPERHIDYYDMSKIKYMIKEQNDCIYYASELLEDSKSQLSQIKHELVEEFQALRNTIEYKDMMSQVLEMEQQLDQQKLKLEKEQKKLNRETHKVKKLERETKV